MSTPLSTPHRVAPVLAALLLLIGAAVLGGWWAAQSLVVAQTLREGRTVADMAENIGRWASQYGGVHARTQGIGAPMPGNFLTRSVFAVNDGDTRLLAGVRADAAGERAALERVETYYWKNPALVQREVADVIAAAGSSSRYRLTARTVLNPSNAPGAFEIEALDALQADPGHREYWVLREGRLLYARAVIAQASCLRCHTSAAAAPEFIRTNSMFNGGGGFGYVEGKPVGLVSVTVPIPDASAALAGALSPKLWAAAGLGLAGLIWLALLAARRR
jgi:Protein of unknown function (DUF3365)